MKRFLQILFSVKNDNNYRKIIRIMGFKISLFSSKQLLKEILYKIKKNEKQVKKLSKEQLELVNKLKNIENLERFYMTEKPWKNLKVYLSELSASQSADFIIKNMPTTPSFSGRFRLYDHILSNHIKEGLYLEFGVHVGKSINYISKIKPDKIIYGFDSFEGLPEAWITDYDAGHFKMNGLPEVNPNVELIKGYFDETLPQFVQEKGDFDIAFINIDCDLYSSTKTIFNNLKNHISSGTIICFDDFFNYPNWQEHEYKALTEFLNETGFKIEYLGYVYTNTKVAIKIV